MPTAGLQLWIEAPHYFRLCYDLNRAAQLIALLPASVGVICDVSHIVASGSTPRQFVDLAGSRISHVHLRDAEPGYIHHSIGNGRVDFVDALDALEQSGYDGAYSLELETRDVGDDDRPAAALQPVVTSARCSPGRVFERRGPRNTPAKASTVI